MRYKIGQVLYVLLNRETKICPVQVVEEITKRTLNGETINYVVRVGKKGEMMPLSEMGGQVFDSIETLRHTLFERITRSVESIITSTITRANEWYPNQVEVTSVTPTPQSIIKDEEMSEIMSSAEESTVTLPDGTTAKIRMPLPGM